MALKRFRDWSISLKVLSITLAVIVAMLAWEIFFLLPQIKTRMIELKMENIRNSTEILYTLIVEYDERIRIKKEFSLEEGQKRAMTRASNMRYGKDGYFWINDLQPKMIMHPNYPKEKKPEWYAENGLVNYSDPYGVKLFIEFVNVCKAEGSGFVKYHWTKPGKEDKAPDPKISYVRIFKPWGWIIGTGAYTDDINTAVARIRNISIIGSIAIFIIIFIATFFVIERSIAKPLNNVIAAMEKMKTGDLSLDEISVRSNDEAGRLALVFNAVSENLKDLSLSSLKVSSGDYSVKMPVRSEKDTISKSFNKMVEEINKSSSELHSNSMDVVMMLTEYFGVMEQIGIGDLSVRANETTGNDLFDQLGKSTNRMLDSFRKMEGLFNEAAKGNLEIKVDVRSDKDSMAQSLQSMIDGMKKANNELHMNNMDIAMNLTEYFSVLNQLGQGDLEVKASESTGNDLFDQLGKATNGMIRSLKDIVDVAKTVAEGDLTKNVQPRSDKDELSLSFNRMINNMKELVMKVKDQANALANSSGTLAQISEQSSQTVSQLSMTSSQISASTSSVAQSSQNASTGAQTADGSSRKGKELMSKLVEKIQIIKNVEDQSAKAMNGLSVSSAKIGEIVSVITKIADQTNLLSLNAAIEAARAGEAGHGFAVVADEVRKLAESSASSAQEIARIIKSVQEETRKAQDSVQSGKKEIDDGAMLTEESNAKFTEIAAQVENIAHQIEQIAAAAQESAASAEEAAASSEEQAAAMQEIATTASSLSDSARVLLGAIEKFKV